MYILNCALLHGIILSIILFTVQFCAQKRNTTEWFHVSEKSNEWKPLEKQLFFIFCVHVYKSWLFNSSQRSCVCVCISVDLTVNVCHCLLFLKLQYITFTAPLCTLQCFQCASEHAPWCARYTHERKSCARFTWDYTCILGYASGVDTASVSVIINKYMITAAVPDV